jgi:hypothetical protein
MRVVVTPGMICTIVMIGDDKVDENKHLESLSGNGHRNGFALEDKNVEIRKVKVMECKSCS